MDISRFIALEDLSTGLQSKVLRTQKALLAAGVENPSVGQALAVVLAQREESPPPEPARAKRTKYSSETKEQALRRLEAGESPSRIARDLGIANLPSLYQWKSAAAKAKSLPEPAQRQGPETARKRTK